MMDKREIARAYAVDWLGLGESVVAEMFSMGAEDPELSAYYGYPRIQAYILWERQAQVEQASGNAIDGTDRDIV
jgi:hypothetical protein